VACPSVTIVVVVINVMGTTFTPSIKQCILQYVVQSLTFEFKFSCGVISLVPWNMSDFFRAQEVTGSGRYQQFCMSGTFACPNHI